LIDDGQSTKAIYLKCLNEKYVLFQKRQTDLLLNQSKYVIQKK